MSQAPNQPAAAASGQPEAPVSYAPVAVAGKRVKPVKEPPPLPTIPTGAACVFAGGINLILGALLAALHLAARPVEQVSALPAQPDRSVVYYVPGDAKEEDSQRWLRKRQQMIDGPSGEVKITESDLNVWAQSSFPKGTAEGSIVFVRDTPNFRINGEQLQVSLPGDLHIFGLVRPLLIHGEGKFSGKSFTPDEIYIGQLPVSRVPGLAGRVKEKIDEAYPVPAGLGEAWSKVEEVAASDKSLVLKVQ